MLPESLDSDPDRLARFRREAEVLAALNHPNIAAIYGVESSGGALALVMELVEGPTLADALEAAHEQGIVHRDLKPANVKVRDDGRVKVLDFGLAKALGQTIERTDPLNSPTLSAVATQRGIVIGTAAYMAPEQAKGRGGSPRGHLGIRRGPVRDVDPPTAVRGRNRPGNPCASDRARTGPASASGGDPCVDP